MSKPRATPQRSQVFKTQGRTVLCCCSTRHRRFVDDLVHVMALPTGSRVRLRYGDDVCDPQLRLIGYIPSPPISGMRALIAHVDFGEVDAHLLPLRTGSVVDLQTVGSVTFLEVELGEFVEERVGLPFREVLEKAATLRLPGPGEDDKEPDGYFCQLLTSHPDLTYGSDTEIWERIGARFLKAISSDAHAAFPFVFNINILGARTRKSVATKRGAVVTPAFSRSELHIRTLTNESSFGSIIDEPIGEISITTSHPEVRLSSDTDLPIDTTRNLLIAGLTARVGIRPAYGALAITARRRRFRDVEPTHEEDATTTKREPVQKITVELPVVVGRNWLRIAGILVISIGIAAHALDIENGAITAEALWKSAAVLAAAFVALWMGLKPQSGD